ncbi:aldo/keto reductase [Robinsoniella peoriensis]|uniref:aldo/keto reductase n=1 Tax=Robinsoniella peoriensis TaxID=180332 RepID=UPI00085BF370|nr:aldo/keto reductase [Robinsoniella peoriensis]
MPKYPLGFGMMRLPVDESDPNKVKYEEACEMVDTFLERGFTYFDTSFVYQNGHNEENVREILVKRHKRDSFELATKLPSFLIKEKEKVLETFEQQLSNLGVDYFDYYLLHSIYSTTYDSQIIPCGMFEFAAEMKKQGKIRNFGFSFHDKPELLDRVLTEHPETDFVQLVVNYYDWESPFVQARRCYEVARKHGTKVIIMEPVKGGLLAELPTETRQELASINSKCSDVEYAFRFAAGLDGIICVLSGMNAISQVLQNTELFKNISPLSEAEQALLFQAVPIYKKAGPLKRSDFGIYENICENGMPVADILDAYNSIMLQVNRGCSVQCENGYYRGLQFMAGRTVGKSWIDEKIIDREGNDITELVRTAEQYLIENTFL